MILEGLYDYYEDLLIIIAELAFNMVSVIKLHSELALF